MVMPVTTEPRDVLYRQVFDDLVELHASVSLAYFKKGYIEVGHIAHGWYLRVQRGGQSVFLLNDHGYIGEAAPLRRSMLEHTVALSWLAADGDSVGETLKSGHGSSVAKIRQALADADWPDLSRMDAALATTLGADHSNDYLLHAVHRIKKYGTPHDLTQYLAETQQSHPTYESAIAYYDIRSKEMLGKPHSTLDPSGFCAVHLALALSYFMSLFDPVPIEAELAEIGNRIRQIDIEDLLRKGQPIPTEYGYVPPA